VQAWLDLSQESREADKRNLPELVDEATFIEHRK
jgi:hypothetical protein